LTPLGVGDIISVSKANTRAGETLTLDRRLHGRALPLALVICVLALLLGGCADQRVCPTIPEPNRPDPTRSTPTGLLDLFEHVYETRDTTAYGELLAEQYQFCFAQEGYHIPEGPDTCIDGATDLARTERMLADPNVQAISFDFGRTVMPWYECTTEVGVALCGLFEPDVRVRIGAQRTTSLHFITWRALKDAFAEGATPLEPGDYWVTHAWFDVTVIPDPKHHPLWVIIRIREFSSE